MAAETVTHPQFRRIFPHLPVGAANPSRRCTITAHFGEVGDIIRVGTAGRGDKIGANCAVQISAVDTHATPTHTFSLELFKTGETPIVIIHESTAGQAGGVARSSLAPTVEDGVGYVVPNEGWEFRLICDAAAATQAATGVAVVCLDINGHRDTGEITE